MRNLLFLVPAFPPTGGTPVLRIVKWIKFLSSMGYSIDVITRHHPSSTELQDKSLLNDIPKNVRIHRLEKEFSGLRKAYAFYRKLKKLTSETTYSWLITTAPPDQFIYLGYVFSLWFNVNWHCDLREPPRGGHSYRGKRKRLLVSRATEITTAWPTHSILPKYISEQANCQWIPHGFDPNDFHNDLKPSQEKPIVFYHFGSLESARQNPTVFIEVLAELFDSNELSREDCEFHFVGGITNSSLKRNLRSKIKSKNLNKVIKIKNFMEHKKGLKLLQRSHVGLVFHKAPSLSHKMFEYLGSNRPILAYYHENSPMKNILSAKKGIYWVDYGDRKKLKKTIKKLVKNNKLEQISRSIQKTYNLKNVVKKLEKIYQ